jgi:hypothetical protein
MTKVIILGEEPKKEKKKIVFVKALNIYYEFFNAICGASSYKNIEFICVNYLGENYDLMFAYDEDRDKGCLFLGHFNDGIV